MSRKEILQNMSQKLFKLNEIYFSYPSDYKHGIVVLSQIDFIANDYSDGFTIRLNRNGFPKIEIGYNDFDIETYKILKTEPLENKSFDEVEVGFIDNMEDYDDLKGRYAIKVNIKEEGIDDEVFEQVSKEVFKILQNLERWKKNGQTKEQLKEQLKAEKDAEKQRIKAEKEQAKLLKKSTKKNL